MIMGIVSRSAYRSVNQLGQSKMQGQGGWQDQPSIGHQAVVVKGNVDAVEMVAW